ncbi:MAG TPA: GntR family transcriptional regulator [Levilinea sp.]|nr:GntR family transcriptional regulator [Levilinea sp.]
MKNSSSPILSTDLFNTLKGRIIRWGYAPGHRLTEDGLCAEFGVSRSPVREALHMLVENGLVEKEPYRGYSVKQPDMREILDLYDVRLALELFVVAQLARNGLAQTLYDQLAVTWQVMLEGLPLMDTDFPAKDEEFHETLALATGNNALVQSLRSIDERLHFIRANDITSTKRLRITCEQHLNILKCIQERNVECAQEALRMNIMHGRTNVEEEVKEAIARAYLGSGEPR